MERKPPAPSAQLELGLFGHARELVEIHEVANACRISERQVRYMIETGIFLIIRINDGPNPKREHFRIKRSTVEAWYLEEHLQRNGVELPYRQSEEVKYWRQHLQEKAKKDL